MTSISCAFASALLFSQAAFAAPSENPPSSEVTRQIAEQGRVMAGVETALVERRQLSRALRAVGKVQYNETALATITSRVDGYVERLFVDYTGVQVKAGDHLVELYSPDLLLVGSVAQGVMTQSRRPVLIVRGQEP